MRAFAPLLIAATLASCTTTPEPHQPTLQAQQDLARLLAGKAPGPKMSCLQNYNTYDMQIIDGRTVAFKQGARGVYLLHLSPGCDQLATGHYALLAKQFGGMGYCQGDIVHVVDTANHFTVGSCGIVAIVPYRVAGSRY